MERITCKLGYEIEVDYEIEDRVNAVLSQDNLFVITDTNVFKLYRDKLMLEALGKRLYVVRAGEDSKQLKVVGQICKAMLKADCNRKTRVVALGGGVVGDLAGFVASVFMRGVEYIQIPTTLLAMVDSSVGGKTAVDLSNYKNMIGVFKQPSKVLVCVDFLATLPARELRSGIGETIKTALLDADIFAFVNANLPQLFVTESAFVVELICRCIRFKISVVEQDECEMGLRRILNLGHTIGHGLEGGQKHKLSHGEYVLNGIYYELQLARFARCVNEDYAKKIMILVDTALGGKHCPVKNVTKMLPYIFADKKNTDGNVHCVLPVKEGETKTITYTRSEFEQALERLA